MSGDTRTIAESVFAEIGKRFPWLTLRYQPNDPVEISIEMPEQLGLKHRVWLALQNGDELTVAIGGFFQAEWFPCTNSDKVTEYITVVSGFLAGEYRVVEFLRNGECVKARLEAPSESGWRRVGLWARPWALWPFGTKQRVLRNA